MQRASDWVGAGSTGAGRPGRYRAEVISSQASPAGPPPADLDCPQYRLSLDLGEVAVGHRLIADGLCLHDDCLTLFYSFTGPAPTEPFEPAALHLNAWYDADVSPDSGDFRGAFGLSGDGRRIAGNISYQAPPADATTAWLDIFPVGFDTTMHVDKDWTPDDDYLRGRVSRLTIDLTRRTASVELFR
jgi:hypothetical protein